VSKKAGILQRLEQGVVLAAEGYLFELERRGYLQAGPYVPEVVVDDPEAVRQLHREFLRAGSDVMLALTYYAHRDKLRTIGREGDLEGLNRQAVRLAKEVADEGDALVAGNISNTWVYDHRDPETTSETVRSMYEEQVRWATEEGVDFIVAETLDYVGEALIALEVIKDFGLPAVVNFGSVHTTTKDGCTSQQTSAATSPPCPCPIGRPRRNRPLRL
jgi:betaine-homocysteine S-methyltransferase